MPVQNVSIRESVKVIYKELMEVSLGAGSAYLRAKDTINSYMAEGTLSDREKADILSKHVTELAGSITTQSLQIALAMAKEDRDAPYILSKLDEDTNATIAQIAKVTKDTEMVDAEILNRNIQSWQVQGTLKRDYGIDATTLDATVPIVPALSYRSEGIKYESIKQVQASTYETYAQSFRKDGVVTIDKTPEGNLAIGTAGTTDGLSYWQTENAEKQIEKTTKDISLVDAEIQNKTYQGWQLQGGLKREYGINPYELTINTDIVPSTAFHSEGVKYETIRQAKANTYGVYAGSYRTHGVVQYTLNDDGNLAGSISGSSDGLTYWQTKVAQRQEQGFDDNMRQHVANSSATMVSLLVSANPDDRTVYDPYLGSWQTAINYLNASDGGVYGNKGGA